MVIVQSNWVIRIVFIMLALALLASMAVLVQAQDEAASTEGCIYGRVWYDRNKNGVQNDNEIPIEAASVSLLGHPPFRWQTGPYIMVDHQITRDFGAYAFCNLRSGTYELRFSPPKGIFKEDLVVTSGSNPAGPIQFEQGGTVEVNLGLGPVVISTESATLNSP